MFNKFPYLTVVCKITPDGINESIVWSSKPFLASGKEEARTIAITKAVQETEDFGDGSNMKVYVVPFVE